MMISGDLLQGDDSIIEDYEQIYTSYLIMSSSNNNKCQELRNHPCHSLQTSDMLTCTLLQGGWKSIGQESKG